MNRAVYASSERMDWETPKDFFDTQNKKYGPIDLDVCATYKNAKCVRYFTETDDGLVRSWFGCCWMNPPYGKEISKWVEKAVLEVQTKHADKVICLLPARTDTRWWHSWIVPFAHTIDFIKGRIRFVGAKASAPFPSVVVVFTDNSVLKH